MIKRIPSTRIWTLNQLAHKMVVNALEMERIFENSIAVANVHCLPLLANIFTLCTRSQWKHEPV